MSDELYLNALQVSDDDWYRLKYKFDEIPPVFNPFVLYMYTTLWRYNMTKCNRICILFQEISNRTHVSRTPKPEYPIARSQLTERGPLWFGPIQFLMELCIWYCWWLKSCTTWDVWNPKSNRKNYQPQLVSQISAINSSNVIPNRYLPGSPLAKNHLSAKSLKFPENSHNNTWWIHGKLVYLPWVWPPPSNSGKWRFRLGFPTENVIILVVTVTGPDPIFTYQFTIQISYSYLIHVGKYTS